MATALPLTNRILSSNAKSIKFRSISGQFGDGYQQIAPDGINNKIDSWEITWGGITQAEVTALEAILDVNGTWGIYTWIPTWETASKKFRILDGYKKTTEGNSGVFFISCTLTQIFDIG